MVRWALRRASDYHYIGPEGKRQAGTGTSAPRASFLNQARPVGERGAYSVQEKQRQPESSRERRPEDVDDLIFREEPASGSSQR